MSTRVSTFDHRSSFLFSRAPDTQAILSWILQINSMEFSALATFQIGAILKSERSTGHNVIRVPAVPMSLVSVVAKAVPMSLVSVVAKQRKHI